MTYKEFNKEINKLRLGCEYGYSIITVYDPKSLYPLVYISQTKLNRVIVTSNIVYLPKNVGYELLTLCYELLTLCNELARTPLDEREIVTLD